MSWFGVTLLGVKAVFRPAQEPRQLNGKLDRLAADVAHIKVDAAQMNRNWHACSVQLPHPMGATG